MAAALAIQKLETSGFQTSLARSRAFVQRWAYAYCDAGIEALKDKPRGGSVATNQRRERVRGIDRLRATDPDLRISVLGRAAIYEH